MFERMFGANHAMIDLMWGGESMTLGCGFCLAGLTPVVLPWILVWLGGFLAWLVLVHRYEPPQQASPSKWVASGFLVFLIGTIASVDLWTLFLAFWTVRVAHRAITLRKAARQAAPTVDLAQIPSPPETEDGPSAMKPPIDPSEVATFHVRILQFLAGGLVVKTAMILMGIRIIDLR